MYTYPAPPASVGGDLTTIEVHHLLRTPAVLRRRLTELLAGRFIADYLLAGRYTAQGGAILYETGEPIFAADAPEGVAPGGEYPVTVMTEGELASARTVKWGLDSIVTDEAISRLQVAPVDRGLRKLSNSIIRHVDGVALGVIASKVTQTFAAPSPWTTADAIIDGVLSAKAAAEEANEDEAFDLSTVVLRPSQFAKVAARFVSSNLVPRENDNTVVTGVIPDYLGLTWTTSPNVPFTDPLLVDRDQLGGMADENIQSPGYTGRDGVEVKSIREDKEDRYRIRARRITVPVVLNPSGGIRITGTGV